MLAVSLSACGNSDTGVANAESSANQTPAGNNTQSKNDVNSDSESRSNILIAYFTAAGNSGVDAVCSASYSVVNGEAVGRLRAIANMIHTKTGGKLFSIKASVIYPTDEGELIEYAADEQATLCYPSKWHIRLLRCFRGRCGDLFSA